MSLARMLKLARFRGGAQPGAAVTRAGQFGTRLAAAKLLNFAQVERNVKSIPACSTSLVVNDLRAERGPKSRFKNLKTLAIMLTANRSSVELRDPQIRAENDPLTDKLVKTTPLLEGLE